jgi:hypothetical protein
MEHAALLRTSSLLAAIGDADASHGDSLDFDQLLEQFRQRAFGGLLLVVLLPTFIPVPIGIGAITGPLIALVGLQMALTFQHPWLPRWLGRRSLKRATVQRFAQRFRRPLHWLERVCKPRLPQLLERTWAYVLTGLQLVLLGLLLALPIPLTNYPFGAIVLLYCVALIERDGALLLIAWTLGIGTIGGSVLLSNEAIDMIGRVLG